MKRRVFLLRPMLVALGLLLAACNSTVEAPQGADTSLQAAALTWTPQDLGVLPSGSASIAYGASADGSVVVGDSYNSSTGERAFRWTASEGMQDLGVLPGGSYSYAYGVSADGSVVVGDSYNSSTGRRAFRWTASGGMQDLGTLPGGNISAARAVSADGSTVVGISTSSTGEHAFRWTASGGMEDLGVLPGGYSSFAHGVSADGSVVVGISSSSAGTRAFRWTASEGMQDLGVLPGGSYSQAQGVSADGSVVVGYSASSTENRAFRWTVSGGMEDLGVLPGGYSSTARGVSADGSLVVGTSSSSAGLRAFRWTSSGGMQDLGVLPEGSFSAARGVSADGSVVVGYGNSSTGNRGIRWTQQNTQDSQTITFDALAGKTYGDAPLTVSATASSELAVSFTSDTPGVCTVADTDTPSTAQVTLVSAGTCTLTASQAGNDTYAAATPVSQSFTVAKAAQTIAFTSTVPESASAGGSYTVSATASSGLPVSFSSTTESVCSVAGSTVSFIAAGTCTVAADQAGNNNYGAAPRQSQTITVKPKDTTPPVITPTVIGTLGSNGWYTSNVEVSFTVTDDESDVSNQDGCDPITINSDTAGVTLTCSATSAGGTSSESVTLKRDATAPTLAPTVSPDPVLLNGTATATPNAGDALSEVASESCDAVLTDSVGTKSVTCTATDDAGNSASASAGYEVLYGFSGFSQPVDNTSPNKAKAGQTIPLKWRLTDAGGAPVTTLADVQLSVASLSCSFGSTPNAVEEYASGDSGLQNLGDGLYQYNWKTPTTYAGSCKTLQLDLGDGLRRTAAFEFTK